MSVPELLPRERRVVANALTHRVLEWSPARETGAPIVCAHGFLDHAWTFHFLAQHLARAGHRVIAFDWRGHGETEWIGRGGYYHFEDYLLDLVELAPQLTGGAPHHWLGHSMGGTASAMFAATRPTGLLTLTLCEGLGPPAVPLEAAPERIAGWLSSVARSRGATPRPMRDLDEATKRLLTQNADLEPERARFLAAKGTREVEGGLAWRFDPLHRTSSPRVFRPESFCALLTRIEVPVLVVSAEHGYRTADHAERVAALPSARETLLPGVGHNMHWRGAEPLAGAVLTHTALAHTSDTASGSR